MPVDKIFIIYYSKAMFLDHGQNFESPILFFKNITNLDNDNKRFY